MDENRIICGDALEILRTLPTESINCCVTSPPYYGLRDYGVDGQIGLETTPDEYISRLVSVFGEVKRVLRGDGTLWVNIADTYATGTNAPRQQSKNPGVGANRPEAQNSVPRAGTPKGCKAKDLIGVPWALAFALRDDGWYLRSAIIWHKPNALPESCRDRPTRSYEHILLLSKSPRYYYDQDAVRPPVAASTIERMKRGRSADNKYANGIPGQATQKINLPRAARPDFEPPTTRNLRDVWSVSTSAYRGAHFAAFPVELITPCILAGSPENGIVLDPFFGSGTTGVAAKKLGRRYIGIDLNPDYCRLANERVKEGDSENI
ncbi:MAG: site-specific DNA-methyltransferase [Oscillospiraceae bacterium]|jgi:DNA modification methylase|nr:site-specific DNA-methyltransferase [Oscillospiraceae bacterium]